VSVITTPGTFVWLEATFAHEFPPAEGVAYMDQQGQMFMPDTVLARTGQPFHFRSSEDVLHNVRVIRSDKKPIFNVATPPFGSYMHTFDEPGLYNVTCDIHATMRGTVYVASTPYVGTADERGLPYLDLLHLIVHERKQEAGLTAGEAWRIVRERARLREHERAALDTYAGTLGLDDDFRAFIEELYPVLVAAMAEQHWDYSRPRWLHRQFGV